MKFDLNVIKFEVAKWWLNKKQITNSIEFEMFRLNCINTISLIDSYTNIYSGCLFNFIKKVLPHHGLKLFYNYPFSILKEQEILNPSFLFHPELLLFFYFCKLGF